MAGIVALSLLLIQPILVSAYGAGIGAIRARRWHRLIGLAVVVAVAIHVVGLYLYSPDDITDALLLVAPTPFGVYGVIAMWCLGLTAILAVARSRLRIASGTWRLVHSMLSAVVVVTGVIHALLIDGTMGSASKLVLCVSLLVATTLVLVHLNLVQPYRARRRTRRSPSG